MAHEYDTENVFAKILRGEIPSQTVYEDEYTIAIMDIMPRGKGHCLVVPRKPVRNILDCDDETLGHVAKTTALMARTVKAAFKADGVTVQQFNESAGGQVIFHMHVHVIPRFEGVSLKPHTGEMEDQDTLAKHAEKIRATLS